MEPISRAIAPNDRMFEGDGYDPERYFAMGRQAVELVRRYCDSPGRILDFGCGHGRVMRWLAAEYPEAELWGCDVNLDGVRFCEQEFGARGIVSSPDPNKITLPRCDLIWVGSVFTHLPLESWRSFLRLLADSLDGVLAFSTAGRQIADALRGGERVGIGERGPEVVREYDETGFAFSDYLNTDTPGFGYTLTSPARSASEVQSAGLRFVAHHESAWMRQDVVIATP